MVDNRTSKFRRNELLENLLSELNTDLQPSEKVLVRQQTPDRNPYPLILVMGPLRSGTTLFTQWLANTGLVAYPTNILSRFYQAPIIGAKVQLLLTDPRFDFRGELSEFAQQAEYRSENGKTKGALAPNEFWYFWRRFLADPGRDIWSDEELRQSMDVQTMLSELSGMTEVFQKPFAAKGMLFNYNIPFLDSVLKNVLFVHIVRNEVSNAESVLEARKRQLGDERQWYSFDIPEKEQLMQLSPFEQAVGQVRAINQAVEAGLSNVADARKMVVQYEDFCNAPEKYFEELTSKLNITGAQYTGDKKFEVTRKR
ncbi:MULTISPECIES: sulfotransferase [unclassified Pseudomonas]|uniref:sulfotransferase n=1 Tax=unclassified Pseudomonas TaxID=196821 RepID=UPI00193100B3|nr:sulfotransferase [Pseudomonas sp. R84]